MVKYNHLDRLQMKQSNLGLFYICLSLYVSLLFVYFYFFYFLLIFYFHYYFSSASSSAAAASANSEDSKSHGKGRFIIYVEDRRCKRFKTIMLMTFFKHFGHGCTRDLVLDFLRQSGVSLKKNSSWLVNPYCVSFKSNSFVMKYFHRRVVAFHNSLPKPNPVCASLTLVEVV
jgi:hypothetical protein